MKIVFYNTSSANNVINKELTNVHEYDIKLKEDTSIKLPKIVLKSDEYIDFNYAYIEKFKRYYFVDKIEIYPNGIYNLYLRCDALETYKEDILKCDGYITQQKQNVNKYYDSGYKVELRKEVDIYKSDVTLSETKSTMILSTIGG